MALHQKRGNVIEENDNSSRSYNTSQQNFELIERYQIRGDISARNQLITNNMGFVYQCANEYKVRKKLSREALDDLVQEGVLGFIHAIDLYDLSRGFSLLTYAGSWIVEYMNRSCSKDNTMHIPRFRRNEKGKQKAVNGLNLIDAKIYAGMDAYRFDDEGDQLKFKEPYEDETIRRELHESLLKEKLLEDLQGREREVTLLYYGLNGKAPMSLSEIARYFRDNGNGSSDVSSLNRDGKRGLSREAINKARSSAIGKIQRNFRLKRVRFEDVVWS